MLTYCLSSLSVPLGESVLVSFSSAVSDVLAPLDNVTVVSGGEDAIAFNVTVCAVDAGKTVIKARANATE